MSVCVCVFSIVSHISSVILWRRQRIFGKDKVFLVKVKDFSIFLCLRQKSFIFANVYLAY